MFTRGGKVGWDDSARYVKGEKKSVGGIAESQKRGDVESMLR